MAHITKFGKHGLPISSAVLVGVLALTVYYNKLFQGLGFTEMFKGGDKLAQAYAITTCVLIGVVLLSAIAYGVKKDEIKNSKDTDTGKVTRIPEATYDIGALTLTVGVVGSFVFAMVAKFQQGQDFSNIFTQNKVMLGLLTTVIAGGVLLLLSEGLGRMMNDANATVEDDQKKGQAIPINTSPASVFHGQITNCVGISKSHTA